MDKQQQMQQKSVELQMIGQQMKQVQKQLQALDQQVEEIHITKQAISDLAKTEKGTETLFPVSPGIFVKGQINDNAELIVNVGSNVAVNKSMEETKGLIQSQLQEINDFQKELTLNLQKLGVKAQEMEKELSSLMK